MADDSDSYDDRRALAVRLETLSFEEVETDGVISPSTLLRFSIGGTIEVRGQRQVLYDDCAVLDFLVNSVSALIRMRIENLRELRILDPNLCDYWELTLEPVSKMVTIFMNNGSFRSAWAPLVEDLTDEISAVANFARNVMPNYFDQRELLYSTCL